MRTGLANPTATSEKKNNALRIPAGNQWDHGTGRKGRPPTKKKEWDPAEDFQIASTMLAVDGLLVATFSRRCSRAMQKIKELLWPSANIIATFCYCETTAMVTVLVGRGDHRLPFIRSATHLFKTVQQLFPLPSRHQCRVSSRGRLLRKRTFFVSEATPSSTVAPVRRSKRLRLQ